MWESVVQFFDSESFMPHGHCYLWRPDVLWMNVISDGVIAASYYSIPVCLIYLIRRRNDLEFNWIVKMFAMFILACGTTHVMDIVTIWHPEYGLEGFIKMATAIISVTTAILLWPLIPRALAVPSPKQLQEAQDKLRVLNQELEARVEERTRELRVREVELKQAKEAAEAANAAKSAFLANMSHEIRTPLGAILGFAELMVTGEPSPSERQNSVEVIKRNGRLLSKIINDILDLSKVEAGRLEAEKVDVHFDDVIRDIDSLLNLEASEKGIKLSLISEGLIPRVFQTDPLRLRQILMNIIGNAIKFTSRGSVEVKVKLLSEGLPSPKLAFFVTDTGRGIPSDQVDKLFAPFTQADASTTRKFGGTGLGLVLSKKLANVLGGDVVLKESRPDIGTTFLITIDPGEYDRVHLHSFSHADNQAKNAVTERKNNLANLKILLVEDSLDNQMLITRVLRIAGAEVETASNGREGVEKALAGDFALVLMDLQMPEMDGYQATQELRRRGFQRPIIALTAHAMAEERRRCLESGFNDHLSKPIDFDGLLAVLAMHHQMVSN